MMDDPSDFLKAGGTIGMMVGGVVFLAKLMRAQYEQRILTYAELIKSKEGDIKEAAVRERDLYERIIKHHDNRPNQSDSGQGRDGS